MVDLNQAASWIERQTLNLVGVGDPVEQIVAAAILGVLIIASSSITLGWTLVLVPVALLFGLIGIVRLIPAVDELYPL